MNLATSTSLTESKNSSNTRVIRYPTITASYIKLKLFQIAPAELENIISKHSSVQEVAVAGIADKKNPEIGELATAFVVLVIYKTMQFLNSKFFRKLTSKMIS